MCGLITSPGSFGEITSSISAAKERREAASAVIVVAVAALRKVRRSTGSLGVVGIESSRDSIVQPAGLPTPALIPFQASNPPVRLAISRKPARRRMLVAIELRYTHARFRCPRAQAATATRADDLRLLRPG